MGELIDLYFHYGGTWVKDGEGLEYINGEFSEVLNFDPNYMSIIDMKKIFTEKQPRFCL